MGDSILVRVEFNASPVRGSDARQVQTSLGAARDARVTNEALVPSRKKEISVLFQFRSRR